MEDVREANERYYGRDLQLAQSAWLEMGTSWRIRKDVMWESGLLAMGWIQLRRNFGVLERILSNLPGDFDNGDSGGTD